MAWYNRYFLARLPSKNKTMREGTAHKERQGGKCDRLGHCGMENSSWEGRGPGGREGDAGADRNIDIDEGGEDENDGEREKNRRAEKRNREERGKDEGRGNARGGGEKVSRKGERRRRRRWRHQTLAIRRPQRVAVRTSGATEPLHASQAHDRTPDAHSFEWSSCLWLWRRGRGGEGERGGERETERKREREEVREGAGSKRTQGAQGALRAFVVVEPPPI